MTSIMFRPPEPPGVTAGAHEPRRARVAVSRTLDEAERIADLLRDREIDALVETDDVQLAMPGASILPGVFGASGGMFAYPVTVAFADRVRARAVLEEHAPTGAPAPAATLARGVLLTLALGCLVVAGRVAFT